MRKQFLFPVILIFILMNVCTGQVYTHEYYFDEALRITKKSKSVVMGKGLKEDQLFRLDYFEKAAGYKILLAHFIDSSLKILEGTYTRFNKNGRVENQGNYHNNQKEGIWQKWDSLGQKKDSIIFQNGNAMKTASFYYHKNGTSLFYSFKDSLADTYQTFTYDDKGGMTAEVFFNGQTGMLKRYDSGRVRLDSVFTREEREASFAGGQPAWINYLQKNLNANVPVENGAPKGTYRVMVKFIVAKDGSLSDLKAETNNGYGMEKEVIRILKKGPAWEPAVQYGIKVNAYRRQPITFIVENRR